MVRTGRGLGRPVVRILVLTAAVSMTGACTGAAVDADPAPEAGGTLTYALIQQPPPPLDPQRIFLAEDRAFASAFLHRSLTAYTAGDDGARLTADLATDVGTPDDTGSVWTFELRDGITFEDGSPIDCADVAFGVSRAFDPDIVAAAGWSESASLLDVPRDSAGESTYRGPYVDDPGGQAAFDAAVSCAPDGRTITFRLATPRADFGHAATTLTFAPVPVGTPAGSGPDQGVLSSGPYRVDERAPDRVVRLVRNAAWERDTDDVRPAHPEVVELDLGVEPDVIAERLGAADGPGATTIGDPLTAEFLSADGALPVGRVRGFDGGVTFLAVNTTRLTVVEHRQAILAALDRVAVHEALGADAAGEPADGLIPPTLPEHQPTGLDDDLLTAPVPGSGNPEVARALIGAAGEPMPTVRFAYLDGPEYRAAADVVAASLARAGIEVALHPIARADYFGAVQAPDAPYELVIGLAATPWGSPAALVPRLLTPAGGAANLSRYDDPDFTDDVDRALAELDDSSRADRWADLDRRAVRDGVIIPLQYTTQVRVAGANVDGAGLISPPGAWDYASMSIEP